MSETDRLGLGFETLATDADGARFEVGLPAAAEAFRGHFPGRPILPGVAQLAVVEAAISLFRGRDLRLSEVSGLRFRRTVGPGDRLALALEVTGDGPIRFQIRSGPDAVSAGSVRVDEAPSPASTASGAPAELDPQIDPRIDPKGDSKIGPPIEAAGRVPHAPPARLIERLLTGANGEFVGLASIPFESPFVAEGWAPALLALEVAAQTAALHEAHARDGSGDGAARVGYLVAVRHARLTAGRLAAGVPLRARLCETGSMPPLAIYDFAVEQAATTVAAGTLSTWIAAG